MLETLSAVASVVFILLVFIAVIAATFFVTKLIGKKYATAQGSNSGAITILDRAYVGQDRMLLIVRAAGRTLLLGVTPNHIETLSELEEDQLPQLPQQAQESSFSDMFKDVMQKTMKRGTGKQEEGNP